MAIMTDRPVPRRARRAGLGAVLLVVLALTTACVGAGSSPGGSYEDRTELGLVALANAERSARGLPALRWDPQLAWLAQEWSRTMAATGSLAHRNLQATISGPIGFQSLGENILVSTCGVSATDMHRMWMDAPTHRAVMLDGRFDSVGIGVVCGADGLAWATANFGRT